MKLLHISAGLAPKHPGGLPAYVEELIGELARRDHEIVYLDPTGRTRLPVAQIIQRRGRITRYEICNSGINSSFGLGTAEPRREVTASPKVQRLFAQILDDVRPDLVHIHELIGLPLSLLDEGHRRSIPMVFTAQDYFSLCPTVKLFHAGDFRCTLPADALDCDQCCAGALTNAEAAALKIIDLRNRPRLNAALRSLVESTIATRSERSAYVQRRYQFVEAINRLDRVFCMSKPQRDVMVDRGIRADRPKILRLSRQTISEKPPPQRKAADRIILIALNVDSIAKGIGVLTRAFDLLLQLKVKVELRMYGKRCEIPPNPLITQMGEYSLTQLDEICADAHAGIIPSLWWESYAYVGPEMLSRGLPLLVSNLGGMTDYVRDGETGIIFDPNDHTALAAAIEKFAANKLDRDCLLSGAAVAYQQFQPFADHVDDMEREYAELLIKPAAAS